LYLIQLGALLAVWLASYFSGLDVILSLLFMAVILIEGVNQTRSKLTLNRFVMAASGYYFVPGHQYGNKLGNARGRVLYFRFGTLVYTGNSFDCSVICSISSRSSLL
jgi:hypothetical protein